MALWKPQGEFRITDLDNGYFLVPLATKNDYSVGLLNAPWSIMGYYLTVQPCSPSFSTKEGNVCFYCGYPGKVSMHVSPVFPFILTVGLVLGKFIKIDYNTAASQMGKFPRMAIELDSRKPLVSKILIDGKILSNEYEY